MSAELYLAGMRHVQMEPVWGGSFDTAAELRGDLRDGPRERQLSRQAARAGGPAGRSRMAGARRSGARARAVGSDAALLLLRFKALSGDQEPEVIADCFSGLLAVEGADAVPLVTSFAEARDKEVREAAILALGASRRPDAVDWLKERFASIADLETRQCILLSLATSRTETAVEFLLEVIRSGSTQTSAMAVSAMEVNRTDRRIQGEIEKALQARAS